MQSLSSKFRQVAFVVITALLAVTLASCPSTPAPGSGNLRMVVTTGFSVATPEEGLSTVAEAEVIGLVLTVQRLTLRGTSGTSDAVVLSQPLTLDLAETAGMAQWVADVTAGEGSYAGASLIVSNASVTLSGDPANPIALPLPASGLYEITLPFEVQPDSTRILMLDFGGLGLFLDANNNLVFEPVPALVLRSQASDVRIEGQIGALNRSGLTFTLETGDGAFAINFSGASIYKAGDLESPTGAPDDLEDGQTVAVQGALGTADALTPAKVEILDLPETEGNDEGDRITLCHFHPGDESAEAYTIVVSRALLQTHLDHGDFIGPCDEGDTFTLSYIAGVGGAISGEATQEVAPGNNGTAVTAVAEDGFAFAGWSDGRTDNPRTDTAVGANLSVTANFTETFSLTYTAGEGGTLTGQTSQSVLPGASGTQVTAVRNTGFVFSKWSDDRTDNPRTDENVTADVTVTAIFTPVYALTYTAGEGGFLEGDTSQMVVAGSNGTPVTAVPAAEHAFVGWSDGGMDNPRTDTAVSGDVTVTANFALEYTLTYAAGPNGQIDGVSPQVVPSGLSGMPVTAVGDPGFGFFRWSDGRMDNPRADVPETGDISVTAEFTSAVQLTYVAGPNGHLDGAAEQTIGMGGSGRAVTAVPETGYAFEDWSDGRTDNPRTDREVMSDLSVVANFVEGHALTYTAGLNGTLTGATMQAVPVGASGTPVTAVPDEGFTFVSWSDGVTDNPRTDTNVTADVTVEANFLQVFTVEYLAGERGVISGETLQRITQGDDGTAVTAVGDDGFGLANWSDGSTENPRTDSNVQSNLTVTAIFAPRVKLRYAEDGRGHVEGDLYQEIEIGGSGAEVMAVADEGSLFSQWSDGSTENPRLDAEVFDDIDVAAEFIDLPEMIAVPTGSFVMGRTDSGDDITQSTDELPRHDVTLSAYEIGKYEVTALQFGQLVIYMLHPNRGLLRRTNGELWVGQNVFVYVGEGVELQAAFGFSLPEHSSTMIDGRIIPKTKVGLPDSTVYSMANHPATAVTWIGAALYANWLSELQGLEPVYDPDTFEGDLTKSGYHLPTEAQWERAAAWDGEKHWIYGFASDELETRDRATFYAGVYNPPPDFGDINFINPLGLEQDALTPYTSPVGWFNGVNISPNGNIQTLDSRSPIGAYDMSGNAAEWCHDWYSSTYYADSPSIDPPGPQTGDEKVFRGGAWGRTTGKLNLRTAKRFRFPAPQVDGVMSFRIARTTGTPPRYTLVYAPGPNGTLAGELSQSILPGENGAPVTAVADEGFGFSTWSDGRTDNPRMEENVRMDIAVTAEFAVAVTLQYAAGPNGALEGATEQVFGLGGTGTPVTAIPDAGYGFQQWSDGQTGNPRTDENVTGDLAVSAIFVPEFAVEYFAGPNGSISGSVQQFVNEGADGIPVTAVPDSGFVFSRWSDGRTDNPREDTGVTEIIAVTASFVEVFSLTYAAGPNGTLSGDLEQEVLLGGSGTMVTATGNNGFFFSDWSDGRLDNPRVDVDVSEPVDVTANFISQVTLSYAAGENGTLAGEALQTLEPGQDGTAVTAIPDDNYLFLQWSDGSVQNPRTDLAVTDSVNVIAAFFERVEMLPVPAGTFTMGRRDDGDDALFGKSDELPRHDVTLSAYEIGKYEITNEQYTLFMNYLVHASRNLLRQEDGSVWDRQERGIYYFDTESPQRIFFYIFGECCIRYNLSTRTFSPLSKPGLPEGTDYNMAKNPATEPTWFGAVLYANWLSERAGLDPVYDLDTWEGDFTKNGYRLPTEAEWERAAAWDGEKHWVYGFTSDTLEGRARSNFHDGPWDPPPDLGNTAFVNPLGLLQDAKTAYTSPVGWFNGVNISPNGNVQTVDSRSPVGAYDMSGNLVEWCHDRYSATYYSVSPAVNPTGPAEGDLRVQRGGTWGRLVQKGLQRSAVRRGFSPDLGDGIIGFRLARTLETGAKSGGDGAGSTSPDGGTK